MIGAAAPEPALADYVRALGRADVRLIALPRAPAAGAGPLDAALIAAAAGEAVCAWDEDSLHDPRRLEVQQQIRVAAGARSA